MTTNYTSILNDNLDMLPGYDFPADMVELSDGSLATWDDLYDEEYEEYEEEDDGLVHFMDGTTMPEWEYLEKLRNDMRSIVKEHGRDSEEFRDLFSYYSDIYKDINGFRPRCLDFLEE